MNESDMSAEAGTVLSWHQAVNEGDVPRFAGLVAPDVRLEGFADEDRAGVAELGEWVESTRVQIAPRRLFRRGPVVVVEQSVAWWSADAGELSEPAQSGMLFELGNGTITRIVRYPDGARALEAADMDESDMEVERVR